MEVLTDPLPFDFSELDRVAHFLDALASDRSKRHASADELCSDEYVDFVDGAQIEKRAQQPASAFHQHVGHSSPAELVEQLLDPAGVR